MILNEIQIGDRVKVFTQVGLMKEPKWVRGIFLDHVPEDKAMVEVSGNKILSETRNIKRHVRLPYVDGACKGLEEFASNNWSNLKDLTIKAYKEIMGRDPAELKIDDDEKIIYDSTESISIGPAIIERESFSEFREVPCWEVGMVVSDGGSYWEPPSVDEIQVGNQENFVNAANLFIDTLWKETHRSFWDNAGFAYPYEDQAP